MTRGLLIVFEGVDSAGKKTQVELLKKKLKKLKQEVETVSFPAYKSRFGKLVGKYLKGAFGSFDNLPPELVALLYSIDRYQFKQKLFKMLEKGKIVLADRYTPSAMAFEGALVDEEDRKNFTDWVEFVESRLPKPDLVFFLDMPIEAAQSLIKRRKRKKDIHENELQFQEKVREVYSQLSAEREDWIMIRCADKIGDEWKIKKPGQISDEILHIIRETFLL